MTIPKTKITIFGFNFDVLKISFWVKQKFLLKTNRHFGQVENADVFSSNFYKFDLSIFAYSQIRKVGCLNLRFTNIRLVDICL